ncbi:class I SAM-dependent methyltransferase [Kamptonema cortianum]|nr:class I SAM-dependent methyltransferase [Oscillatoria laete-virens]MDK3158173.1 class I SAM-dependent methyltransferase [Kamptonema cortianum]MDL5054959.1 class I SAM-dependent methyltransferase [Oscillatoria laete-virens NRMC-F 0139]
MRWLLKAALQGGISLLPKSREINYLFQKHVTRVVRLSQPYFDTRVDLCRRHLRGYQGVYPDRIPVTTVELGTGWLPIVTVGFSLCGFERIYSVDIDPLLRADRLALTLEYWLKAVDTGTVADLPLNEDRIWLARDVHRELAASAIDAREAMRRLGVEIMVTDARHLPLEAGSVDYCFSTVTFEHIPRDVLQAILQEFRRVASPTAVMTHFIDLSDHYSHFDRSITPYHFLRFSGRTWRLFNNRLLFQNRLRISDYRQLHEHAGFEILSEVNTTGTAAQIAAIRVAPEFSHYSPADLQVTSSMMVSRPRYS